MVRSGGSTPPVSIVGFVSRCITDIIRPTGSASMWPFRRRSSPKQFWEWFTKHEDALFNAGPMDALLQTALAAQLAAVHKNLVWEVSPESEAPRELVISADGIREAFDAVEALVDVAPPLPRWKFTRFRPRVANYAELELKFGDVELNANAVEGALFTDGVLIGIKLYIRGCNSEDEDPYLHASYILLDGCIGEYDMICKVG